jgi:hypothetical protein
MVAVAESRYNEVADIAGELVKFCPGRAVTPTRRTGICRGTSSAAASTGRPDARGMVAGQQDRS